MWRSVVGNDIRVIVRFTCPLASTLTMSPQVRRPNMADKNDSNEIGYGNPPKYRQFVKGQSGNPKGRPKGSQNLGTILDKVVRQRVKVTENGRSREMSKAEAILSQLVNRGLRGDIQAIHELRYWTQCLEDSVEKDSSSPVTHENDNAVMESLLKRIRRSSDDLGDTIDPKDPSNDCLLYTSPSP